MTSSCATSGSPRCRTRPPPWSTSRGSPRSAARSAAPCPWPGPGASSTTSIARCWSSTTATTPSIASTPTWRPTRRSTSAAAGWWRPASTRWSRVEEFTLLFKSSREFFFAPVVEYGPAAGVEGHRRRRPGAAGRFLAHQGVDRRLLRRARVPGHGQGRLPGRPQARSGRGGAGRGRHARGAPLATPARLADGSVRPAEAGTAEVDILEMQEVEGSHNAVDVGELALDAFTDGKSRPRYLGRPRDTLPVDAGSVEPADADDSGAIDAAALITDEHDDGGHDDGGLYDHGADAPTSDALLATEHDDSDAPTGGGAAVGRRRPGGRSGRRRRGRRRRSRHRRSPAARPAVAPRRARTAVHCAR
jgi:hypothetical protein